MQEASSARGASVTKLNSSLANQNNLADFIPQAGADFVATPAIDELTQRALAYIDIGYAVHFSGPAGTGKTTLALHVASKIGRRCTLLHGDDELRGSDLLGKDAGYRRQSVRDNYVSSILKTEETVSLMWSSNRLTTACEQGHTVIYDEFTRSPATANNAFLSILEEGILTIPSSGTEKNYVRVHPDFRAIFTSNPEEYVGVHKSQDALIDRMITLEVTHQDRDTELAIVRAKSQRTLEEATQIVDLIRALREKLGSKNGPTVRAALAIAKIMDHRNAKISCNDPVFMTTCQDVLLYNATRQSGKQFTKSDLDSIIRFVIRPAAGGRVGAASSGNAITMASPSPSPISSTSTSPSVSMSASSNAKTSVSSPKIATAKVGDELPEVAVSSALESIAQSIDGLLAPPSAEAAHAGKDAVDRLSQEKQGDQVKGTDEVSDGQGQRESVGRRLMRPPLFETTNVPMVAAVSSK